MATLSIAVLGPLRVTVGGQPVGGFEYTKVRALLAYLAVSAGRPQTRAELCALLWPELPEKTARRNLTQALSALRRALSEAGAADQHLTTTTETVQLEAGPNLDVDAVQFAQALNVAERHAHRSWPTCGQCGERLQTAVTLYRGDFLSQLYVADSAPFEEWALAQREQLRQRVLTALERLAQMAEWRGQYGPAAELARRQVELDPLSETGHREVMRLLALDGQRAAAEAHYEHLRRTLSAELAVEPEPETTALHTRLRGGPPETLRRFLPPPFNSPAPPNALIGRQHDLAAVTALLREDGLRAVTLTGTPGVGKTRLALEAAQALRFDFEDGVHFIELAPVSQAEGVGLALARALGVKEKPGQPLAAALTGWLRPRHTLLVLDNFEHVLEAASLVAEVLAAAPAVKVLTTSRAPLRLRVEQQYLVEPLGLPGPETDAPLAEAVALFVSRARAVRPGFALTPENTPAVNEICLKLNGLPLALELIAARAKTHSPQALRQQLEQGLAVVAHGGRDLPPRHQSLRNAIRWSYERLDANAQSVFACLGVFAGGFSAEAAQAVAGPEQAALTALETLHDASLVQTQTVFGEPRFALLETLREFALEVLTTQAALAPAMQRHAEYFAQLAEQAAPALIGPEQKRWLEALDIDLPNLRAALRWSQDHAAVLNLRLAAALDLYWTGRGLAREGRAWLKAGLARAPDAPAAQRARALLAAGRLAWKQGDYPEAGELVRAGRQIYTTLGDAAGQAWGAYNLGMVHFNQADFEQARALFEESLTYAQQAADWYAEAAALNGLGNVANRRGHYAEAWSYYEQALALHEQRRNHTDMAGIRLNLCVTELDQGHPQAAKHYGEEALAASRHLGDRVIISLCLLNLAQALIALGELDSARRYLEETIAMQRQQGDSESLAPPLNSLGRMLLQAGELPQARALLGEALQLRLESGDRRGIAVSLETFGQLAHAEGHSAQAVRFFAVAGALRDAIGVPQPPNRRAEQEQRFADLRARLGDAAFDAAWAEGRQWTMEAAAQAARS